MTPWCIARASHVCVHFLLILSLSFVHPPPSAPHSPLSNHIHFIESSRTRWFGWAGRNQEQPSCNTRTKQPLATSRSFSANKSINYLKRVRQISDLWSVAAKLSTQITSMCRVARCCPVLSLPFFTVAKVSLSSILRQSLSEVRPTRTDLWGVGTDPCDPAPVLGFPGPGAGSGRRYRDPHGQGRPVIFGQHPETMDISESNVSGPKSQFRSRTSHGLWLLSGSAYYRGVDFLVAPLRRSRIQHLCRCITWGPRRPCRVMLPHRAMKSKKSVKVRKKKKTDKNALPMYIYRAGPAQNKN